ncbi:hypothetical protein [Fibrella aquatilis]|uniref:DUF3575 domain-containing protein n=1 Tax=Fibrella aquatilis TaxID=2817059 RepID=A0A939G954_9BACT|nr:hypothetical protein [Fibrella aquatilis]MBO0933275.1 hypothetical protein [Fibrella aquatilis]
MKQLFLKSALVGCLLAFCGQLMAQSARSIIKYAPVSNVGYEHVLNEKRSIYGGLSYYSFGGGDIGVSALGLKAEYRFYGLANNGKEAPEGLWVAPTLLFWNISASDGYDKGSVFVTQLGGIAGYQWLFNQKISLEPALGVAFTAVGSGGGDSLLEAGVLPLFALRVGYVLK